MRTFVNRNRFFGDIIDEYMYKRGYDQSTNLPANFCDVDYYGRELMKHCNHGSQFANIDKHMGNKAGQYIALLKYTQRRGIPLPPYVPQTIPFQSENVYQLRSRFGGGRRWILKPVNASFRIGVVVLDSYEDLVEAIRGKPRFTMWILQRYVEQPLLMRGRKFHVRVYALLVRKSKVFSVYMYRRGVMYFAKLPYVSRDISADTHLSGGTTPEDMRFFPEDFERTFPGRTAHVMPQIYRIVHDTCDAILDMLECSNRSQRCFKIVAYDLLVDQSFRCYLAETNVRQIEFRYPPQQFRRTLYTNVLDLYFTDAVNRKYWEHILSREARQSPRTILEAFSNTSNPKTANSGMVALGAVCVVLALGVIAKKAGSAK